MIQRDRGLMLRIQGSGVGDWYGPLVNETIGESFPNTVRMMLINRSECIDDGAAFALLLGPLLAASMYYTTWQTLVANPTEPRSNEWNIEPPQVLDSTPSPMTAFRGSVRVPDSLIQRHSAILALTALCLSRQHAVHLTCLLSLILIFHATWSRRQDIKTMKRDAFGEREPAFAGSGWVKLSEWRRTWAIISFSLIVTAFVVALKAIADALGLGEGYGMSLWLIARRS